MKTQLYYFTGTGNCLSVARKIGAALDDVTLTSIAGVTEPRIAGDVIGVISPIYMYDMPHIVIDFIKRIHQAQYLFFVYAGGGEPGGGLRSVQRLCKKRNLDLSALFNIAMPSNYTPFGCPDLQEQRSMLDAIDGRIAAIADTVSRRERHVDRNPTGFFKTIIHPGVLYRLGHAMIRRLDKDFSADESCNGCEICSKVCPVGNISIQEGRPQWNHRCQQCFACQNWCPQKAIQYRNKTDGVERYHHPDVKVSDIINSNKPA
jgi:ferredoxin